MDTGTGLQLGRRHFLLGLTPGFFRPPGFLRPSLQRISGVGFRVLHHSRAPFSASPRRYLVIHGDEDTARDVLTSYMATHAGTAFIVTGKQREVMIEGVKLDPNRMFSRVGAEENIRKLTPGLDVEKIVSALDFLDARRPGLLAQLLPGRGSRLVALHNNRDYSVNDELSASDQTSIRQPGLPRHFFLCTHPKDYAVLAQSPYNVVLQTRPDPDDGSLSRHAARRGVRYINLECAIGESAAQLERLRWLDEHLA